MKQIKKGDVISPMGGALKHTVLFNPAKPSGIGAGREWPGVTDDMWKLLFNSLTDNSTKERNAICRIYSVSYQKLLKYKTPEKTEQNRDKTVEKPPEPTSYKEVLVLKKAKIVEHEEAIAAIHIEIAGMRTLALKEAKAWIKELEALA